MFSNIKDQWYSLAVSVLLGISVIGNLAQHRVIRSLSVAGAAAQEIQGVGTRVPALSVRDLSGKPTLIEYQQQKTPTLLYAFSPSCSWCKRNTAALHDLSRLIGSRYRLVGLALSSAGLEGYLAEHPIDFPVYTGVPASAIDAYRLRSTPETIVISADGVVLRVWTGAFEGPNKEDIERYFSVRLPTVIAATEIGQLLKK
ncbi:MAG TPA: TlpA disulfide reductase family protein [Bryobacteraceae bacterium]|nr:TlpA disulfide reductase family protein [Bryobacteraceae bacterium]